MPTPRAGRIIRPGSKISRKTAPAALLAEFAEAGRLSLEALAK